MNTPIYVCLIIAVITGIAYWLGERDGRKARFMNLLYVMFILSFAVLMLVTAKVTVSV